MTFGSVCSGIEAASVAWHPLGWEASWLSEIEPFPCSLLAHRYPNTPNLGDMTKIAEWIRMGVVDAPDVFVGGTPCQAFSVAGLRGGLEDPRGGLTLEFIKIGDAIDDERAKNGREPSIIVWENVPGVLSSKDNAFGAFLGGLCGEECELVPSGKRWSNAGCVYGPKRTVAWRVLDAQYFGVAQRRKRVFVIASARDIDPSEILFEFDGLRRDTSPSRETRKGSASSVGDGSMFKDTPILNDQGGSVMAVEDGLVGTLRRETHGHEPIIFREGSFGQYNQDSTFATIKASGGVLGGGSETFVTYPIHDKATRHGGERGVANGLGIGQPSDPCPTLDTSGNHTVAFDAYNQTTSDVFMTLRADKADNEHIPTVYYPHAVAHVFKERAGCEGGGKGYLGKDELTFTVSCHQDQSVHKGMQVRRLTPTECERLQGFPDTYTDISYRNKPAADGPRYKALGNSMAVPVMHWLGQRIHNALK